MPCAALKTIKDGRKVELSGIVLIRQRPGKGNVTFITVEDESGIANVIVWQRLYEKYRRTVLSAAMIAVTGQVQKEGEVIHVIADRIEDDPSCSAPSAKLDFPHRTGPGDGARNGGPDRRHQPPRLPPPAARTTPSASSRATSTSAQGQPAGPDDDKVAFSAKYCE